MNARISLILCLLLSTAACKKDAAPIATPEANVPKEVQAQKAVPALPLVAAPFLSQPLPTTIIEATSEALPIWRSFAKNRPALIIAANTPAMFPVPAELRSGVASLLKSGDDKELVRRSSPDNADPLLLPVMSLNVALDAGWFSQVIWIFPTKQLPEQLELTTFQKQLTEAQIATPEEAASFKLNQGSFSGIIRGIPFTAAPAEALPPLEQSALLHIDADYFKPLYGGEIKTPLYALMMDLLDQIKEQNWKIAAATVALSNQTFDGLPLQTRFLGKDLATILKNPRMLRETFPRQWDRRSKALYLENFMQKEEIHKIYLEMEKAEPNDPDVKYGLYGISRQLNKADAALLYLKTAVQLDPVFAQEYLALSTVAGEKNLPKKVVEMLQLAHNAQPNNPFFLLLLAQTMINTGHQEETKALKEKLAALQWSKIYYPEQAEATAALVKLLDGQ